jgi:NAD(P)-dependent dehydrogenase (short-subunit alcohol dehydrogenase family)
MNALTDQHVVVLGGTSGIGLATAEAAVATGARVTVTGRDRTRLDKAAAQLGDHAAAHQVDATDPAALRDFFTGLGSLDHLVLALSGSSGMGPFAALDLAQLRAGFEGKLFPHVAAAQAALPTLAETGSVTFISAVSARTAAPGAAGLAAINGAIEAMVPTLAVELAPRRVNAVSPGVVDTPWWSGMPEADRQALFQQYAERSPVRKVGRPTDVARAVLSVVDNDFMTGVVLEVDGGLRYA